MDMEQPPDNIEEFLKGKTAQKIRIELCFGSWENTYTLYEGKFINAMALGLSFSPGDELIAKIHGASYIGHVSRNKTKQIILDADTSTTIIKIPIKMTGETLLDDIPEWWKDIDETDVEDGFEGSI